MTSLQPKSKGDDGTMVSGFIEEKNGYLRLTHAQYKLKIPTKYKTTGSYILRIE